MTNTTNFLSPIGYQLSIHKLPNVGFYAQQCNLPGITLPNAIQSTRFSEVPVAGDKMQWEPFTIDFMIDENMDNYLAVWNWLTEVGFTNDDTQFVSSDLNSSGFMQILGADNRVIRTVFFDDLIPTSLRTIQFSSTESDVIYIQGSAEFLYSTYKIE